VNLTKAAVRELRERSRRAQARNDTMEARVLEALLDVAERTASLAGATNRTYRFDLSVDLVTAALRMQRQAIVNLVPADDDHTIVAVDEVLGALARVVEKTVELMRALSAGTAPQEPVLERLDTAVLVLLTTAGRSVEAGVAQR
jgi:hypothetical protein